MVLGFWISQDHGMKMGMGVLGRVPGQNGQVKKSLLAAAKVNLTLIDMIFAAIQKAAALPVNVKWLVRPSYYAGIARGSTSSKLMVCLACQRL